MQLFVGGFSDKITERDLAKFFSKVCQPSLINIIKDIESGKSKGVAIVEITPDEKGEEAVKIFNGTILEGNNITVMRTLVLPGEMETRLWFSDHASQLLLHIGVANAQTVVDYGCGPGTFTIPCARIVGPEGKVYAYDTQKPLLRQVESSARAAGLSNIETVISDILNPKINLNNKTIDVILVYDVMHDIKNPGELLKECHRILKNDGILSIFPMHIGTEKFRDLIGKLGLFSFRNSFSPPGFKAASEILNFNTNHDRFGYTGRHLDH